MKPGQSSLLLQLFFVTLSDVHFNVQIARFPPRSPKPTALDWSSIQEQGTAHIKPYRWQGSWYTSPAGPAAPPPLPPSHVQAWQPTSSTPSRCEKPSKARWFPSTVYLLHCSDTPQQQQAREWNPTDKVDNIHQGLSSSQPMPACTPQGDCELLLF